MASGNLSTQILEFLKGPSANLKPSVKGNSLWMCCIAPQHGKKEENPSFKITLEGEYAGAAYCFGCAWRGGWKEVCALFGLGKESKFLVQTRPYELYSEEDLHTLLGSKDSVKEAKPGESVEDWPENQSWRGLSGEFLTKLGAKLILSSREAQLRLYAYVSGKRVGYINCVIVPEENKLSYVNSPGSWAKNSLFPYDFVRDNYPKLDTLYLTEGVRDAPMMLYHGYPALSILGTNNWSDKCKSLVLRLAPRQVVILFDPDASGDRATEVVYQSLKSSIDTKIVRLPSKPSGKKAIDPADFKKWQADKLVKRVEKMTCHQVKLRLGIEFFKRSPKQNKTKTEYCR